MLRGFFQVIDIMEHLYYPVSPNAVDPVSRQTATFATLLSILTRSGGDALLDILDQTPAKRLINYLKSFVYKEQNRMDWVVKILLDQGTEMGKSCCCWGSKVLLTTHTQLIQLINSYPQLLISPYRLPFLSHPFLSFPMIYPINRWGR